MTKKFRLSELARASEFEFDLPTPGPIYVETLKTSHLGEIEKLLADDQVNSETVARRVIQLLGHRARLDPKVTDPEDGPPLSEEEIRGIPSEEVERFAQVFMSKRPGYAKSKELGEITKEASETHCDFLARALRHYVASLKASWENIVKPFENGAFGSVVRDAWQASNRASDILGKTIADLKKPDTESIVTPLAPLPRFENPIDHTNRKLDQLIRQFERTRPAVAQISDVINTMKDTALAMQASYVSNARSTGRQSIIALTFAVLGIIASSAFSYLTLKDARESGVENQKHVKTLQDEIKALREAQKEDRAALLDAVSKAQAKSASPEKAGR